MIIWIASYPRSGSTWIRALISTYLFSEKENKVFENIKKITNFPNINHFSTQGSSGGPVGLVNVSFIKDVTLSTSAFGAEYDNALSGVLSFEQKDANIDGLSGNFRLGSSEAGITFEGPISIINNK